MCKLKYCIIAEWWDVFGEHYENTMYYPTREKMEKALKQIQNNLKHDAFVAKYNVVTVER